MNSLVKVSLVASISLVSLLASETDVTSMSTQYALKWYNKDYGTWGQEEDNKNSFYNYSYNCTNFVSQCMIAGLNNYESSYDNLYKTRPWKDVKSSGYYSWYLNNSSWKGASNFFHYVQQQLKDNNPSKGLVFDYVTADSEEAFMDYQSVKKGDIIFADWTNDGSVDHSMIVTKINSNINSYNRIQVTYQGSSSDSAEGNGEGLKTTLGNINSYNTIFRVYRPLYFKK